MGLFFQPGGSNRVWIYCLNWSNNKTEKDMKTQFTGHHPWRAVISWRQETSLTISLIFCLCRVLRHSSGKNNINGGGEYKFAFQESSGRARRLEFWDRVPDGESGTDGEPERLQRVLLRYQLSTNQRMLVTKTPEAKELTTPKEDR